MSYAPTLTVTEAPPSVHIVFDTLDAGTARITVYRITAEGTQVVRSAEDVFAAGGWAGDDWETPTGVAVTYRAQQFDASGAELGFTDGSTVTIDSNPALGWISDPLDPASVLQVELKDDFAQTLTRTRQMQLHQVGDRTVALLGAMGKLESITLRCQTQTLADADTLNRILSVTNVLIRTAPPTRLPRLLYAVIPQVNEVDQDVQYGGSWVLWDLVGQQVDVNGLDIVVPIVTWQTYIDAFPTWADFNAAYLTWFDAIKNPPEA